MSKYTKCPNCGYAVPVPRDIGRVETRRIGGVPGLWRPAKYRTIRRGDEVLLMLNSVAKSKPRFYRGFVDRKYQGLGLKRIGQKAGDRMALDKATVVNAAAVFVRVRDVA